MDSFDLVPEPGDERDQQRQHHTHQDRTGQRKIKGRVFPAIENVAGEPAERETGPAQEKKERPYDKQERSGGEQNFAKISHRSPLAFAANS